jgi:hypothetical protein
MTGRKARLVAVVLGLVVVGDCHVELLHTRAIGDRVVAALEAYRGRHGRYPRTIDELVPRYLAEKPRGWALTGVPRRFYLAGEDKGFVLFFWHWGYQVYTSHDRRWRNRN